MLSALVVDDEPGVRADLVRILDRRSGVRVVGAAGSVREAADLVRRHRPDVVFLDIRLGDASGFGLLRATDDVDFDVVFVTAYDEYAVRAFEVNALDYLLKPVDPERLRDTLERLRAAREAVPDATARPQTDTRSSRDAPKRDGSTRDRRRGRSSAGHGDGDEPDARPLRYDDWLFLRLSDGRGFIKVAEISHITAEGDYTAVHTTAGERHLILQPLRRWEARLPSTHFLRIHRGSIVNLECVERVEPWSNYTYRIHLRGRAEPLTMSRSYAKRAERLLG
ncbi:MAG: LytR/AlgR family response regulator transcription factor [Gemmatimonadota bacterium]